MKHTKSAWAAVTLTGLVGMCGASAGMMEITPECERALALSAGPVNLRAEAGVLVLGETGYEFVAEPRNGFVCLVERNHEDSLIPQCFDERSRNAHVARALDEGKLIRQGVPFEEILAGREAKLENGIYPPATGPGLVYMVSDYNYIHNNGAIRNIAPHVMFHAPGLSNAAIGADMEVSFQNRGLPMINAQGPHGFMITFTDHASDSSEVVSACAGQLPDPSGFPTFPAWYRG